MAECNGRPGFGNVIAICRAHHLQAGNVRLRHQALNVVAKCQPAPRLGIKVYAGGEAARDTQQIAVDAPLGLRYGIAIDIQQRDGDGCQAIPAGTVDNGMVINNFAVCNFLPRRHVPLIDNCGDLDTAVD